MSGLDYSLEDLSIPNPKVLAERTVLSVEKMIVKDFVYPDYPKKETGRVLLSDLTPDKTDKVATDRFFVDTQQLNECIAQAESLQDMLHSELMAMKVVGLLSFGLRKSGELLARAIYDQKMAKSDLKRAQAIAALEEFHGYTRDQKDKGIDVKSTDTTRGHYININENVLIAAEREAFFEAVVSQLDSYRTQFTMVLSAVKAMIGKQRADTLISSVATPVATNKDEEIPF